MTKPSLSTAASALVAGALLLGCINTARTSIPREESHYERTVPHGLDPAIAFGRVEQALAESYDDLPKVLESQDRRRGTFRLAPIVTYRTGGVQGEVQHARYTLEIVVREASIALAFDLGVDVSGGGYAPRSEIPYVQRSFDEVVENVEKAVALE